MTHRLGMASWLAENDGISHAVQNLFDLSEYEAQAAEIGETTMKHAQQYRIDAAVQKEMQAWRGVHNFGDGLRPVEHARAHRAAMSPERRAELDKEWEA